MVRGWLLALAFVIGVAVVALDLSSGAKPRPSTRRPPAAADVATPRGEDPTLPQASETDDTAPGTTPTITY